MNARNAIVEAVLEDAADDYVPDWTIRHIAQRLSGAQSWSDVEAAVVEALDLMLTAGWVEIGDLVSGRGFLRWDGDNESVMRRVRRSWRAAGPDFHPGDICWLRITPSGELRPEAASPSP